jgi:hypothetical protein
MSGRQGAGGFSIACNATREENLLRRNLSSLGLTEDSNNNLGIELSDRMQWMHFKEDISKDAY